MEQRGGEDSLSSSSNGAAGRKRRAKKKAMYYSECFMKGIRSKDAVSAEDTTNKAYQKWWVEPNCRPREQNENDDSHATMATAVNVGKVLLHDNENDRGCRKGGASQCYQQHQPHTTQQKRKRFQRSSSIDESSIRAAIGDITYAKLREQHKRKKYMNNVTTRESSSTSSLSSSSSASSSSSSTEDRTTVAVVVEDEDDDDHHDNVHDEFHFRQSHYETASDRHKRINRNREKNHKTGQHRDRPIDIERIKAEIIGRLLRNGGNTDDKYVASRVAALESCFARNEQQHKADGTDDGLDGIWITLSKPLYQDCQGRNEAGDFLYSLDRMSFGMFQPANLLCSIQGVFNTVGLGAVPRGIPSKIAKTIGVDTKAGMDSKLNNELRAFSIVTTFSLEPNQTYTGDRVALEPVPTPQTASSSLSVSSTTRLPSSPIPDDQVNSLPTIITRPIRGILTTQGCILPDRSMANRYTVWFTGGILEVNDPPSDLEEWKKIFGSTLQPTPDSKESARMLAAKFLLGAEINASGDQESEMNFRLRRPIGGPEAAFCDAVYVDGDFRIMRGNHGSLFVLQRVSGGSDGEQEDSGNSEGEGTMGEM